MPTQTLGINGLSKELQLVDFDRRLLSRFRAETVFNRFGVEKSIPKNGGKAISFRRLESIYAAGNAGSLANGSAPSALTEGTPGAAIDATWTEVQATVSQYGQYLLISDMAENQSVDMVVPEYTENFAESMKDALDLITRDVLMGGTNVQYASTAGSRGGIGSGMYLNLAELRHAKRTLLANNAKPVKSQNGKFVAITHSNALYDLEGDSNITTIWQYAGERGDQNQLFDVAFQDLPLGFRLFTTTNARIFAGAGASTNLNVYATLVLAEEAYGQVSLASMPAQIITHDVGTSGVLDPLNQVASIGWKAAATAVILNQSLMVRIEHLTAAN